MVLAGQRYISIVAMLFCAALLVGCSDGPVSISASVDPRGWNKDDVKAVVYQNSDTTSMRDIVLFVACDRNMHADIPLEITTVTPDSLRFSEQFLFEPSAADDASDFIVKRVIYRANSLFAREGGYVFRIRRLGSEPLKGIRAVGIEIEPAVAK